MLFDVFRIVLTSQSFGGVSLEKFCEDVLALFCDVLGQGESLVLYVLEQALFV